MTEQFCQAAVDERRGPGPCNLRASRVVAGMHCCGTHELVWKSRLGAGQKIKIHPERALPLDHHCDAPEGSGQLLKCHGPCGLSKPAGEFYPRGGGGGVMSECKPCWNKRTTANKQQRRHGSGASHGPSAPKPVESVPSDAGLDTADGRDRPDPPAPSEAALGEAPAFVLEPDRPDRSGFVYFVEFICINCGRGICEVKVAHENAQIQLRPGLKCSICGGRPVRSGDVRRQFVGNKVDMGRVKRGRPTRAVEARAES